LEEKKIGPMPGEEEPTPMHLRCMAQVRLGAVLRVYQSELIPLERMVKRQRLFPCSVAHVANGQTIELQLIVGEVVKTLPQAHRFGHKLERRGLLGRVLFGAGVLSARGAACRREAGKCQGPQGGTGPRKEVAPRGSGHATRRQSYLRLLLFCRHDK